VLNKKSQTASHLESSDRPNIDPVVFVANEKEYLVGWSPRGPNPVSKDGGRRYGGPQPVLNCSRCPPQTLGQEAASMFFAKNHLLQSVQNTDSTKRAAVG
jgi:hypothetical protein